MMLGLLLMVLAASLVVSAILHGLSKVRPNSLMGLRTGATGLSDAAWYAGNRATAPYLFVLAALFEGAAVLMMVSESDGAPVALYVAVGVSLPVFAVAVLRGNAAAKQAHVEATASLGEEPAEQ